jgi:two-component system chemotaxis sensor kinase CheA
VRLGKPRLGRVRVECRDDADNRLELSVIDDGRGIDPEEVARRAGREVPTTADGVLALLALPGMSTRDTVTTTSGRGMGMDIVRRIAVQQLGGDLELASERGKGTRFTLRVPLSLTIVEAFTFRSGGQSFVVPMSMVDEIVELDRSRVSRPPGRNGGIHIEMLDVRGEPIPLVELDALLGLPVMDAPRRKAILVRRNRQVTAFVVDGMLGQQEVVVRPVDDPLVRTTGVTGSTDLGDGIPTLVVDLLALSGTLAAQKGAIA